MNGLKRYKVLLLSPLPPPEGGIARWTQHILNFYEQIKNHSVVILTHCSTARQMGRITDKNWITRIFTGIINSTFILSSVRKKIKEIQPDIVHFTSSASFGLFKDLAIQRIVISNRKQNVIHFRFGRIPELAQRKNWEWIVLKKVIKRANQVIVIDPHSYKTLINEGFSNINYIPNPLSPELVNKITMQEQQKMKREKGRILFVGHVIPYKGIFELSEACVDIPDTKLIFIGPYEESIKTKLQKIAQKRANGEWLILLGRQEYDIIIKEMLTANIFCLPSYTEGFANVILESMACGCPIIASDVGANSEMLNSERGKPAGLCIPARNIENLKSSIKQLLNDHQLAEILGQTAKQRVMEKYSMPEIWKTLEQVWKQCPTD